MTMNGRVTRLESGRSVWGLFAGCRQVLLRVGIRIIKVGAERSVHNGMNHPWACPCWVVRSTSGETFLNVEQKPSSGNNALHCTFYILKNGLDVPFPFCISRQSMRLRGRICPLWSLLWP